MTSFILKIAECIITKYVCFSDFAVRMVKQEKSLNVRFAKHCHFSLHYSKTVTINNIKVKCSQFGRQVSPVFEHDLHR